MNKLLIGVVALLLLSGAARAEEIWQTLPKPPAMPTPVESGMAPVTTSRCTTRCTARASPCS